MILGIEIGGTKLQLGVGVGDGSPLVVLQRQRVDPKRGAEGIREQIQHFAPPLIERYRPAGIGIGFGGPVDPAAGRVIKSHQVGGWDDFPLADWAQETLGLRSVVGNDSDLAGLAEARFGAGRGFSIVFYNNIGSGIGGALVIGGQLHTGSRGIAAELGHLRPGLQSDRPDQTVEALASGWAIAATAQARVSDPVSHRLGPLMAGGRPQGAESVRQRLIEREEVDERWAGDLLDRCQGHVERLTTEIVAKAAADGNELAREVFQQACQTLGWALAQMITLLAPHVIVIGGGVSLVGEALFLAPLRREVERYVFPPLVGSYQIIPALLGEDVVVHGALANAAARLGS
jgi:glucokinase